MAFSSRATIPPLSRPRTSSRPSALPAAHLVWQRYVLLGAGLGLALSLPNARLLIGTETDPATWQSLALSALFSMALAALFFGGVGALSFTLLRVSRRTRGSAPRAVAALLSGIAALYVVLRGGAEAFRFSSEAALNLGTLEFVVAGWDHLFLPIVSEYAGLAIFLVVATGGAVAMAFAFLRAPLPGPVSSSTLLLKGGASLAALGGLLHVLVTPGMTACCGLDQTADLSLLSSIAARRGEDSDLEKLAKKNGALVPLGAPLETGDLWEAAAPKIRSDRPNVILVMMESVGTSHLGVFGYERDVTPHLDAIAEDSMRFLNARSTASHSNYAQMAILSSLFPRRYSGLDTYERLDYPRVLWHDFLASLGYSTGTYSSQDETWQGMFDFQQTDTATHFRHSRTYEGQHIHMGAEKVVPDEVTIRRAMEWIGTQSGPFGLYVNLQSTHFPYKIPKGTEKRFSPDRPTRGKFHYLHYPKKDLPAVINRYDNALSYVDEQIGRLVEYLRVTGRLNETILVITSDHGELFWEHGMVTHGRSLYDREVRVPLFVHYPDGLSPGDVTRAVSTLDVLPTLATLLDVPPHPAFQGTSLLGPVDARRPIFMNIQGMKAQSGVVCGHYKLIADRASGKLELFDLQKDPGETRNVVTHHPRIAEALRELVSSQMRAQMRYHSPKDAEERSQRYAPRFASCPDALLASSGAEPIAATEGRGTDLSMANLF